MIEKSFLCVVLVYLLTMWFSNIVLDVSCVLELTMFVITGVLLCLPTVTCDKVPDEFKTFR